MNFAQVIFNADKRDGVLYSEKVARLKFAPSLSHFGGKPVTGWLAVTATGLVSMSMVQLAGHCPTVMHVSVSAYSK